MSEKALIKNPLPQDKKIAFINSFCLGDNLIGLVVANNLYLNGYDVDIYGNFSFALKDWFPHLKIFPSITEKSHRILDSYFVVLYMFENELPKDPVDQHVNSIVLSKSPFYKSRMTMVDIEVSVCKEELHLEKVTRDNGLKPLPNLEFRKYKNRIIIHPTSSLERKNWPKAKFIKLTEKLITRGFEPHFILSEKERKDWDDVIKKGFSVPVFSNLSKVAEFIYESGYFIGNDSGIGHLASNLGIPTLSIILRKGVACKWRPAWAPNIVVLSPFWLNPRPLKEKFWKIFISVNKVLRNFEKLISENK